MKTTLKKRRPVFFALLCLLVGLLTGVFLSERLVNLYVPEMALLLVIDDPPAPDYR
jgi:uncharacterized protein YneF (UPF0154 family)